MTVNRVTSVDRETISRQRNVCGAKVNGHSVGRAAQPVQAVHQCFGGHLVVRVAPLFCQPFSPWTIGRLARGYARTDWAKRTVVENTVAGREETRPGP